MAQTVNNLPELMQILDCQPKISRGHLEWKAVKLTGLKLDARDNKFNAEEHWAGIQVHSMEVDGRRYNIGAALDIHISIGRWRKGRTADSWDKACGRAIKKLATAREMDMEVVHNEDSRRLDYECFNFMVRSIGGATLHMISQTLRGSGLKPCEDPPRSLSPPGLIFHLSAYQLRLELVDVQVEGGDSKASKNS